VLNTICTSAGEIIELQNLFQLSGAHVHVTTAKSELGNTIDKEDLPLRLACSHVHVIFFAKDHSS
jgi:hypothetical protein